MKGLFSILLFTLFMNPLYSQRWNDSLLNLSNEELNQYYHKKSRHQKAAAFSLLGGGLLLASISASVASSNIAIDLFSPNPHPPSASTEEVLVWVGLAIAAGSVPLFLASAKNKRRAQIVLGNQVMPVSRSYFIRQTSVGLAIPLGR